jgi:hypothetical protein
MKSGLALLAVLWVAVGCGEQQAEPVKPSHLWYRRPAGDFTADEYSNAGWVPDPPGAWRPNIDDPRSYRRNFNVDWEVNYPIHLPASGKRSTFPIAPPEIDCSVCERLMEDMKRGIATEGNP